MSLRCHTPYKLHFVINFRHRIIFFICRRYIFRLSIFISVNSCQDNFRLLYILPVFRNRNQNSKFFPCKRNNHVLDIISFYTTGV